MLTVEVLMHIDDFEEKIALSFRVLWAFGIASLYKAVNHMDAIQEPNTTLGVRCQVGSAYHGVL